MTKRTPAYNELFHKASFDRHAFLACREMLMQVPGVVTCKADIQINFPTVIL